MGMHNCLLVALFIAAARSASLYERCVTNCDCRTKFTVCTTSPQGCGTNPLRYCQCADGYRATTGRECKQEARIGQKCGDDFICVDEYTTCNSTSKRCECVLGFKRAQTASSSQPRCISSLVRANYGESCQTSVDCDYTQDCIEGTCQCAQGYAYRPAIRNCVESQIGDPCLEDGDCGAVTNSFCSAGACACRRGFLLRQISFKGVNTRICLQPSARPPVRAGEFCNELGNIPGRATIYCQSNLTCTTCPGWLFNPIDRVCVPTVVPPSCIVPKIANGQVTVSTRVRTDVAPARQAIFAQLFCDNGYQVTGGVDSSFCDEISDWSQQLGQCLRQ